MMRIISTLLFAAALSTPAFAADKAELKLEKAEVKYAKTVAKDVAKLSKKFEKLSTKEKDTSDIEKDLAEHYRDELAWLRAKGIQTNEPPTEPQRDPAFPLRVLPEPESETPKMEALRDMLVDLKQGKMKDAKMSKEIAAFSAVLTERYERKNTRYKENKKG